METCTDIARYNASLGGLLVSLALVLALVVLLTCVVVKVVRAVRTLVKVSRWTEWGESSAWSQARLELLLILPIPILIAAVLWAGEPWIELIAR